MPAKPTLSPLAPTPAPGDYLARRRAVAGLTVGEVAERLAALPWAIAPVSRDSVARLADRLTEAEKFGAHFSKAQAALLRNIYRFDVEVYLQLVDLAAAGTGCGLPVPQICTGCACSWHDPCSTVAGTPCAWSDTDPHRCTGCQPVAAPASAELETAS